MYSPLTKWKIFSNHDKEEQQAQEVLKQIILQPPVDLENRLLVTLNVVFFNI